MKKIILMVMCVINIFIFLYCLMTPIVIGGLCYPHHETVNSLQYILLVLSFAVIIASIFLSLKYLLKEKNSKKTKNYSLFIFIVYLVPILLFIVKIGIEKYDESHYELTPCISWDNIQTNTTSKNK